MKKLLEKLSKEYPDLNLGKYTRGLLFITFSDVLNDIKRVKQKIDCKKCVYVAENGGCWAIKRMADPKDPNCDYREREKVSDNYLEFSEDELECDR